VHVATPVPEAVVVPALTVNADVVLVVPSALSVELPEL
jgi:hypothetical protein